MGMGWADRAQGLNGGTQLSSGVGPSSTCQVTDLIWATVWPMCVHCTFVHLPGPGGERPYRYGREKHQRQAPSVWLFTWQRQSLD